MPISRWVDQKTMVHLHNGILCSREKGAPTLHDSMDGTGEHYTKWHKPGGERQIVSETVLMLISRQVGYKLWYILAK